MSPTIHFILGQTATGKTASAAQLAKEQNGELVNCDSRQVYRHLDIITGKTDNPSDIPIHLVDIVDPHDTFTAYDFAQQGIRAINDIVGRGRSPIVVGGTGNYARMLLYLDPTEPKSCHGEPRVHPEQFDLAHCELRRRESMTRTPYEGYSKQDLQKKLMQLDIDYYNKLTPSDQENPRRLVRAIQRLENAEHVLLDPDSPNALANKYDIQITVFLHKDQQLLSSRIEHRVESRLSAGAIEECQNLLREGYTSSDPGLATIGYQSIFRYLAGEIDQSTMKVEWCTKERQYAKRQKTYLLKYFPDAKAVYI